MFKDDWTARHQPVLSRIGIGHVQYRRYKWDEPQGCLVLCPDRCVGGIKINQRKNLLQYKCRTCGKTATIPRSVTDLDKSTTLGRQILVKTAFPRTLYSLQWKLPDANKPADPSEILVPVVPIDPTPTVSVDPTPIIPVHPAPAAPPYSLLSLSHPIPFAPKSVFMTQIIPDTNLSVPPPDALVRSNSLPISSTPTQTQPTSSSSLKLRLPPNSFAMSRSRSTSSMVSRPSTLVATPPSTPSDCPLDKSRKRPTTAEVHPKKGKKVKQA